MSTIARVNGVNIFGKGKTNQQLLSNDKSENSQDREFLINGDDTNNDTENEQAEYSVLNALRENRVFVNLLSFTILFSIVSFNYYIISFYMKYIGGDIYINMIASAFSDMVGNILA